MEEDIADTLRHELAALPFSEELSRGLRLDSWMMQVFFAVLATAVLDFVLTRALRRLQRQTEKTTTVWDDALFRSARDPLRVLVWIFGLSVAFALARSSYTSPVLDLLLSMRDVSVVVVVGWFLTRCVSEGERGWIERKRNRGEIFDLTTSDAIAKLLRISVVITTGLVVLQTLGYSISGVLAFGGIGGIAIGFAAKDLLANFFGGLMIYLDRPFQLGDWVRSPDRNIEGTVERIGWRLTMIRTFDKRPLYIPNALFATIALENPSRMSNRRINETIGIRYADAGKMADIVGAVREMLTGHPEIDTRQTLMVNFNAFASSSLDFFIYCFTKTTDWARFHEVKQDVLLKILGIIEAHGAECAFPTSSLHIESMPPGDFPPAQRDSGAAGVASAESPIPHAPPSGMPSTSGGASRSPAGVSGTPANPSRF